jgi:hypothetical protein
MKAMEAKSGLSIHTLLAYPPYEQGWRGGIVSTWPT